MVRALRVTPASESTSARVRVELVDDVVDDDLGEGDVTVDVEYSGINFKDGLAITGRPGVLTAPNTIPGIDLVGTVRSVTTPGDSPWKAGDRVIVNGWGVGEQHPGGLSERARVDSGWLVALPDGMTPSRAAAIGTAGFTAMLAVLAIERHLPAPADVLVTGAAGGLGSIAIALLSRLGYRVIASTGRAEEHDYLRSLGADEIIDRATLSEPGRPLQSQRWAAAIDSVGSHTLANVLAQSRYGGIVAACGLAQGADLPATVMPFILRSVTLAGINSVYCPPAPRREAWRRLATDLDPLLLDSLTETVGLGAAVEAAERIMRGGVRGRTVVDVRG